MARKKNQEVTEEIVNSDKAEENNEAKEELKKEVKEEVKKAVKKSADQDDKAAEDSKEERVVIAPNISVAAPEPAVNNVKSEFQMPRKMKVSLSTPFLTFCILLITICFLSVFGLIGYGIYYIRVNDIDLFNAKVPKTEYDEMVKKYDDVIEDYEDILDDYEYMLNDYRNELDDYKNTLDRSVTNIKDYESAVYADLEAIQTIMVSLSENSSHNYGRDDANNNGNSDDIFTIYYMDQLESQIQTVVDYLKLVEGKDVELVSFSSYDIDMEEVLDNADLVLYENDIFDFDEDDLLSEDEVGLGKNALAGTYKITDKIGLNGNGDIKEFPYMVCPGYIQIRADFAKKYLGTTDAEELHDKYFCDMETMANTCNEVYKSSKGKVSLFGSTGDVERMYENALEETDIDFDEFLDLTDGNLYDAEMWDNNWYDYMGGASKNKKAMAVVGSVWFTEYILPGTAFDNNNTILVQAPVEFVWGGECAAVPEGSDYPDFAGYVIEEILDNDDLGEKLVYDSEVVFINNKNITDNAVDVSGILNYQDFADFIETILK